MKSYVHSGLAAALALSMASTAAFAQERAANTPLNEATLNAQSSNFIATPDGDLLVEDGSFEAGSPNPFWNEASTNFGTPLCNAATCGTGGGSAIPNTGEWFAWFGGIPAPETASVSQNVTFPNGSATLTFFFSASFCSGNANDFIELLIDGNQEWVVLANDPSCDVVLYTEQTVDASAYADGGVHTIEFRSESGSTGLTSNFLIDDVSLEAGEPPAEARFLVSKNFDDNNPAEVDVMIECSTGLPLSQPATISEGDPVNFVVTDFEQEELNCTVTEVTPEGYSASYDDGDGVSEVNCSWENLVGGQYACAITNSLDDAEVEVTKVWIDENPQFDAVNIAGAEWECTNVGLCRGRECTDGGTLDFFGNPDTDTFSVFPNWDGGTTCHVEEVFLPDGGVEVDDSDCQAIVLFPGDSGSCTIFNTRLYEGIPTLSQYGLALMALLMLGIGFIGFRRFV